MGIVARISGCQNQKELSLEDQIDHAKQLVASDLYDGTVDYRIIATKGKGERLDRPELEEIEELLRTRQIDILIAEDLGRLVRGAEAVRLCGVAVDCGTRVIAPNDFIDTNDDNWEEDVISACRDHVGHNSHTSKRLKQKLMNRFKKFGGATALPIYGYIVPPDAKTYDDWEKDPSAIPIYAELARKIRSMRNCSYVADWLNNDAKVPPGPYAKSKLWTGKLVRETLKNTLLIGKPSRGRRHTIKNHETGRRIAVKNPDGPTFYECPALAFFTEAEFNVLNALLDDHNMGLGRKPVNGADPRAGVPRKRTKWPGQHITCGICNRLYYWGGHGVNEHMMCSGCHKYNCWNGATFDGVDAGGRLARAVLVEIEKLPEFDQAFRERVMERLRARRSTRGADLARTKSKLDAVARELNNCADAIAKLGLNDVLEQKLLRLTLERDSVQANLNALEREPEDDVEVPTMAQITQKAREVFETMAFDSPEFGAAMHRLIPNLKVYPFRLIDGGAIVLRARMTLDLTPLVEPRMLDDLDCGILRREITVDLFNPPQRVAFREQIVQMRAALMTEREVANKLGLTVTAAQSAMALHRLMQERGLTDPYEAVTEATCGDSKFKRHLHPRYRFDPLPPSE